MHDVRASLHEAFRALASVVYASCCRAAGSGLASAVGPAVVRAVLAVVDSFGEAPITKGNRSSLVADATIRYVVAAM